MSPQGKREIRELNDRLSNIDELLLGTGYIEITELDEQLADLKHHFYTRLPELFVEISAKNELYKNLIEDSFGDIKITDNTDVKVLILEDKVKKIRKELESIVKEFDGYIKSYFESFNEGTEGINRIKQHISDSLDMNNKLTKPDSFAENFMMEINSMSLELAKNEGLDYEEAKQLIFEEIIQNVEQAKGRIEYKMKFVEKLREEEEFIKREASGDNIIKGERILHNYRRMIRQLSDLNSISSIKWHEYGAIEIKFDIKPVQPTLYLKINLNGHEFILTRIKIFYNQDKEEKEYSEESEIYEYINNILNNRQWEGNFDIKMIILNIQNYLTSYYDMKE